jgi:hypothetical protein
MTRGFLFTAAAALTLSCGNGPAAGSGEAGDGGIPHYDLVPVDTVGVELGDSNYVFGVISSVDFDHQGNLLVLDPATSSFSVFSPRGEFLERVGRAGSGPGEFLFPSDLCVLSDGVIAVSEPRGRMVHLFGPDYTFHYAIEGFFPSAPFEMKSAPDGGIVGYQRVFRFRDGETGYALARWEGEPEPVIEFLAHTEPIDPEEIISAFMEEDLNFAVSGDGTVFASMSSHDTWEVVGFSPEGEEVFRLERPFTALEKTDEEIQEEIEAFERRVASRPRGGRGGAMAALEYEPEPLKVSISDMFTDSEDRLWVRSGAHRDPWFDVFDRDGAELFTASFDTGTDEYIDMQVYVSPNGIAAWEDDPLNYPRIYLLELDYPEAADPES